MGQEAELWHKHPLKHLMSLWTWKPDSSNLKNLGIPPPKSRRTQSFVDLLCSVINDFGNKSWSLILNIKNIDLLWLLGRTLLRLFCTVATQPGSFGALLGPVPVQPFGEKISFLQCLKVLKTTKGIWELSAPGCEWNPAGGTRTATLTP